MTAHGIAHGTAHGAAHGTAHGTSHSTSQECELRTLVGANRISPSSLKGWRDEFTS